MTAIRLLNNEAELRISYFYAKPFYMNFGFVFTLAFGLPIVATSFVLGNIYLSAGILLVWIALLYLILSVKKRKIKQAKEVYQFGSEEMIYFQGLSYNYGMKINGAPQPVINLNKNGELIQIKSFSRRVIAAFDAPVQKAYVLDKYPDIILPEKLFSMILNPRTEKTREINI
ncbi:hypothetical protein D0C36_21615 [Mucilaginibacter conchicola]|uniref:Uncharacterized protein n=1 Tax=Mucilaginibacter conchicola TaxID=2303333 RepID=A0A372NQ63_9SPHI|nr:hypothetical protein [Mucilaginibacter conchicola]RFZ90393.1 hypothetical protein D0C36_21615 [Mucilaginibacter conchicola]